MRHVLYEATRPTALLLPQLPLEGPGPRSVPDGQTEEFVGTLIILWVPTMSSCKLKYQNISLSLPNSVVQSRNIALPTCSRLVKPWSSVLAPSCTKRFQVSNRRPSAVSSRRSLLVRCKRVITSATAISLSSVQPSLSTLFQSGSL